MTAQDIIERLERASGPDREIDALIDCAVRFPELRPACPTDHKEHMRGILPARGDIWCPTGFLMARDYTASIDAALTLVNVNEKHWPWWTLEGINPNRPLQFEARVWPTWGSHFRSFGATPAIALCIAALKARAALNAGERPEPSPLAALTEARTEIERLKSLVYVPGLWRCAKCNFSLVQANLNAKDGTVTARDKPGDKCPNCDSPLWRVTERDAGNEMVDRAEELLKRATDAEALITEAVKALEEIAQAKMPGQARSIAHATLSKIKSADEDRGGRR